MICNFESSIVNNSENQIQFTFHKFNSRSNSIHSCFRVLEEWTLMTTLAEAFYGRDTYDGRARAKLHDFLTVSEC
jgi:hypothetical protein